MDIAIGLPNAIHDVDADSLIEFAKRADARGFSSLGTVDRIVYPNFEPLLSLAAVAPVTERIRLSTTVLLGPLRSNVAMLAKETLTLDALSGGRFWLGIGLGAREDDYDAAGVAWGQRGKLLDDTLVQLKDIWERGEIGPAPARPGGPEILVGGTVEASFERVAKHADGWIMHSAVPEMFPEPAAQADAAWERAGRGGKPRKATLAYFALGPDAEAQAQRGIGHYYAWLGDYADQIVQSAATSADEVRRYVDGFAEAGCDEVIFFPSSKHPEQVDLLAEAVGK
jgi:alkanesulfonate monooxygenase SsuD/methylene tetrahydromethanopterin reductase-like flavin-dependent oxidoreductase (luciferase family)